MGPEPSKAVFSPELVGSFKHILVVEDNVALRFTLAEWLRLSNYIVYEAANADEAATVLASQIPVDMVITDVQMPGTMDGLGLVDHIQHVASKLPVIVVSANDLWPEIREKNIVFFRKPYDLEILSLKIESMLEITSSRSKP